MIKVASLQYLEEHGPELEWEEVAEAPVPRLDGAAMQIGNLFYVFAGYGSIEYVSAQPGQS